MENISERPLHDQLDHATALLERLARAFDTAVARAATLCSRGGRLDPGLLDQHQGMAYELALADAELLAASTLLAQGGNAAPLDVALGLAFVAEAIPAIVERLERVHIAADLDSSVLHALAADPDLRRLRRDASAPDILARLGAAVAEADGDVGAVALDEATILAQDAFRRFAATKVAPLAQEIHRQDLTVPEALLAPLREMGVFGLAVPEEYGGQAPPEGGNTPMMIAVTEALSEASLAAAGSLITRPEILARALLAGGTEAQKQRFLPAIAAGDPLCAIAITEPDAGSDVAALSLRAIPTEGGWLLNGAKTWCTFAGKAGLLMVVARTDPDRSLGHRGLSLFLVEKPGYEGHDFVYEQPAGGKLTGRAIPTVGYRGMHSYDLAFDGFFVADENLVGGKAGLGKGFYLTMTGMTGGRIQTAGRALGVMKAALTAAIRYTADRKVFAAPLAAFPLTRIKIATMAARFAACRQLAYKVARDLDRGAGRMEASLVKLFACRSAETLTREALQLHGGMGYAEETPVSRYWVDARVLSIFEGAEETLALKVIARSLLEDALAAVPGGAKNT
ncbi:MAG: acyl-CoA dehydrogenase family protein [Rhodospirillales bacterium]|nr:acyl-CoA dehydrogenase family protein [Rhodospirillales bacterium]